MANKTLHEIIESRKHRGPAALLVGLSTVELEALIQAIAEGRPYSWPHEELEALTSAARKLQFILDYYSRHAAQGCA